MILKLWLKGCSLKAKSLRKPTLKRIIIILIVVPIILIHITFCRFCLWLDKFLYQSYLNQPLNKILFIIGVPRSGTSFLLELIGNENSNFTTFRLWELVFAPAIIQKRFLLSVSKLLNKIHFPTKRLLQFISELLFSKMKDIHQLDFNRIEEDELVYLYLYKSAYLIFLFPELEKFHGLVTPDNSQNEQERLKEQLFYESLIKRHLYVFDSNSEKYFLSKNPVHSIRLDSLTTVFPTAKHLLIQRNLEKTLPSSISLYLNLYQFFCTVGNENSIRARTIKMLLDWHFYLHSFYEKSDIECIDIDFQKMIKKPSSIAKYVHQHLNLPIDYHYETYLAEQDAFSKNYKSKHQYQQLSEKELAILPIQK